MFSLLCKAVYNTLHYCCQQICKIVIIQIISPFFNCTGFILYTILAVGVAVYLIFWVAPIKGQSNILIYISICSLIGSLSVTGCKGLSIAIKLTLSGNSQLQNPLAWFFAITVATCITIQMNYLNKSLDIFNTSIVTPIYYVMFTTFTITASAILFKEWSQVTALDIIGTLCGFLVIVCGVFLLHAFKDIKFTFKDLFILMNKSNESPSAGSPSLNRESVSLTIESELHQNNSSTTWQQQQQQQHQRQQSNNDDSEEEILVSERDTFLLTSRSNSNLAYPTTVNTSS